jgi:hypothetical protein
MLFILVEGALVAQWVRPLDLTAHASLSPIRRGFAPGFVNYKKGCTRFAAASDKVYQLLAHGRWFSPGTPASSTTKIGRHDIAEILLKVALIHQKSKSIKSIDFWNLHFSFYCMFFFSIRLLVFFLRLHILNKYFIVMYLTRITLGPCHAPLAQKKSHSVVLIGSNWCIV